MFKNLRDHWKKTFGPETSPYHQRLASEIYIFSELMERRAGEAIQKNNDSGWVTTARQLLRRAKESLEINELDDGWKALNAAKRLEIFGMSEPERNALAIQMEFEASKLNEWRKKTITGIVEGKENKETVARNPGVLIRAVELRDEHFDNRHLMNGLTRRYFRLLFILLVLTISAVMAYFIVLSGNDPDASGSGFTMINYITGVLLFGLLGAITSSILFLRNSFFSAKIIDIHYLWLIALSKIIISSAFSLFIFFLVKSSLARQADIFSFEVSNLFDYLALAFVSGFSERLAQKAIEKFTGKE